MTQEDINIIKGIIKEVEDAKLRNPKASSSFAPSKGNCKRLRTLKAKFTQLTENDLANCFCDQNDRVSFYNDFLIEWNKKDLL